MKKLIIILMLLVSVGAVFAQSALMEISNYEKEIPIEKGWVRYMSIDVENIGDVYLNNVIVSVEGEKSSWFEVETNKTDIAPNQTVSFLLKLYVPLDEEKGNYYFMLDAVSDEVSVSEEFSVNIFTTRSELLLDQIESFRGKIDDLKSSADDAEVRGKDVESVRAYLAEASPLLEAASNDVYNRLYDDATEKIRNAETLITKADFDLSIASAKSIALTQSISLEWILIIVLLIIIISMFLWFFVFRKHEKTRRIPGKIPGLKIKRLIKQEVKKKDYTEEIKNLEEAESLLEEEYREGLISKESYEEMKSKYEEKILNIKTKK